MSTATSFSSNPSNSSDANFRGWGGGFSTALQSLSNWTKYASDSGQINWSTVSAPSAINTKQGYEIYQLTDGNQGSYPIFVRFDFGSGAQSINLPSIWITIGTGWSSNGVLSGIFYNSTQFVSGSAAASPFTSYLCSACGLMIALWAAGASNYGIFISLCRTRTGSGTIDGIGITIISILSGSSTNQYLRADGSGNGAVYTYLNTTPPPTGNGIYGTVTNEYVIRGWNPAETSPEFNFLSYVNGDLSTSVPTQYTVNCWDGNSRVYYAVSSLVTRSFGMLGQSLSLLFLYQ